MTPFILMGRRKLPLENGPSSEEFYDEYKQIWIDKESGEPLVTCIRKRAQSSRFGETQLTESGEGTDQSDIATLRASAFGETTVTKTSEGADQREVMALSASPFGETMITATHEGHDQREVTLSPFSSEAALTEANVGSNNPGSVSINAAYSHV